MTKDEALRLALEALENASNAIESWGSYASEYFQDKHDLQVDINNTQQAITAIKAALEAKDEPVATLEDLEQEIYENTRQFVSLDVMEWMLKRYYTTPPQREPLTDEPVAWCVTYNGELTGNIFENRRIADLCKRNLEAKYGLEESREVVPIYTTPPQRTWVGLTDEEVDQFHNWKDCTWSTNELVRYVEAKLRSKND